MRKIFTVRSKIDKLQSFVNKNCWLLLLTCMTALYSGHLHAQCVQQIWFDDFNDLSKWDYETGDGCGSAAGCGFGNGELQTYTNSASNVSVANSKLTITALYSNGSYTSGKLITKNKVNSSFTYGKIEASMKLSSAGGAWPAFWMLPQNGNWPVTGEIDIMEARHKNPTVEMGTIHYNYGAHQYTGGQVTTTDLSLAFHTYGIEWQKDKITWYLDGVAFFSATPASTVGGAWPFNDTTNPFYMILDLAVGGPGTPFTGNIAATPTDYPTTLQVDWVKVSTGIWNVAITGNKFVYENSTNNGYSVTPVTGATYNWTVPAGATITAGQGTTSVTVNWGTTSGNVSVNVTTSCGTNTYSQAVTSEAAFTVDNILEDFQTNRNITLKSTTGTFVNGTPNPSAVAPNTSATVGKYTRNVSEQYDVLAYQNVNMGNVNDFVTRKRRIQMDVYTAAPVGTKITLQLENSTSALSTNFPTGRHSIYEAIVVKQNAWQTLEFAYVSSPDPNVGIFGVDQLVFLYNSNSYTGDSYYFDNLKTGRSGTQPTGTLSGTLLDYDGNTNLTYKSSTGIYAGAVANPSVTAPNTSATAGKYTRSAADLYDVLFFNGAVGDAGLYKDEVDYFTIDVYTTAPIGTIITLQLENSAQSLSTNYPTGRNSVYQSKTTKTNAWETIRFYYSSSPDGALSNLAIDQVVILANPNSSTNNIYYFDNLKTYTTDPNRNAPFTVETVLEDYQTNRRISYTTSTGTYVNGQASPGGTNTTTVGKYTRNSAELYDVLNYSTTAVTDAAPFKSRTKRFAVDLYTTAPVGSVISFQLETSASVPTNYPTGRNSIYQAITTKQNQWETLVFSYSSTPDGGASDNAVSRIVILFKPNSSTSDIYYIDNIRTLSQSTNALPTVSITSPASGTTFTAPASITINATASDSDGTVTKVDFYSGATLLGTDTTNPYSYAWTGVTAGTYSLTALATDNGNATKTSSAVSVTVSANVAPTVSITAPVNGATYTAPASLAINVTAADSDGTVTKVDFYNGATLLGTDASSPYSFTWTGVTAGTYSLTAKATDNVNAITTSAAVSITVSATTGVNLALNKITTTSSTENANFPGSAAVDGNTSTRWSSAFSDPQYIYVDLGATYSVNRVKVTWEAAYAAAYTVDVSPNGTSSWTTIKNVTGNTALVNDFTGLSGIGRYVRINGTARGTAYGYSIFELEVYGTAGNAAPIVNLSSPADASAFTAPASITISATASDSDGTVSQVDFYNGTTLLGTDTSSPYSYTWAGVAAGTYSITAKATDNSGAASTSSSATITVNTGTAGVCSGTVINGDYSYQVSTTSGTVNWTFVPLSPIAGSTLCIIYINVGSGGYAGYVMTAAGSNFTYSQSQTTGAVLSFYFTYRIGSTTAERNSSATPHSYTVGTTCSGARTATVVNDGVVKPEQLLSVYPNPTDGELVLNLSTKGLENPQLQVIDLAGRVLLSTRYATDKLDVSALPKGVYTLVITHKEGIQQKRFVKK